jgi:hypothetical protein
VWLDEAHLPRVRRARAASLHNGAAFEKWRAEADRQPENPVPQREDILGEALGADRTLFPETMQIDGVR